MHQNLKEPKMCEAKPNEQFGNDGDRYLKKSGCICNVIPHLPLSSNTDFIFANRNFGPWFLHPLVPVHIELSL